MGKPGCINFIHFQTSVSIDKQGAPEFLGQPSDGRKVKLNPRIVFKTMNYDLFDHCASLRMQYLEDGEDDTYVCPERGNFVC